VHGKVPGTHHPAGHDPHEVMVMSESPSGYFQRVVPGRLNGCVGIGLIMFIVVCVALLGARILYQCCCARIVRCTLIDWRGVLNVQYTGGSLIQDGLCNNELL
jgi:hypothetical protein